MHAKLQIVLLGLLFFASLIVQADTTVYSAVNSPDSYHDYSFSITSETSIRLTLPEDAGTGSYILLKAGAVPANNTDYDFASRLDGATNALFLQAPELSAGTWHVRVYTPASAASSHSYDLTLTTDADAESGGPYPVARAFSQLDLSLGTLNAGQTYWYRYEVPALHDGWRLALHTPGTAVVRLRRDSTTGSQVGYSNQALHTFHFSEPELLAGEVYYLSVTPLVDSVTRISSDPASVQTISWDPGTAPLGSQFFVQPDQVGGDYYLKITAQTSNFGAWRHALNVEAGEADFYVRQNSLPTGNGSYRATTPGDDGLVLSANQFGNGQQWYIRVHAQPDSQWQFYTGDIYVHALGDCSGGGIACEVPAYSAINEVDVEVNKSVTVGPEGMAYFRSQVPTGTRAWRLFTRNDQHTLYVRKDVAPVSTSTSYHERSEDLQMLLVPGYLTSDLYYVGVEAEPDTMVFLDSRQQEIRTPAGDGFHFTVAGVTEDKILPGDSIGYGYITYEVTVPVDQIGWEVQGVPTNGTADVYVRQGEVPNINTNNGFSEASGMTIDSVTQVPPSLTDGNWYITVRGEGSFTVDIDSDNPAIPSVSFLNSPAGLLPHDGCENQAGWCYYVVDMDNNAQLNTIGWELALANAPPGTDIAIRRNALPGKWQYRQNGSTGVYNQQYIDLIDDSGVLQDPGHQADIWYIGVYNPSEALGAFELDTYEPVTTAVAFQNIGSPVTVSNQPADQWRFFRVEVPVGALGWDVRLANVSGGEPQMVIRRDELPTATGGTYRLHQRDQWASGEYLTVPYTDMTGRSQDAAGVVEAYRVFHAGVTSPLTAPGTYYIGVRGQSGQTAALNYTIQSRGIGEGGSWSVPVTNLSYNGGVINGTGLAPREVAWYKVTVPANSRSLQLELDVQGAGEATLLVRQGKLPSVYATRAQSLDSDQVNRNEGIYLRKTGDEYFYKYQPSNGEFIPAGDYYVGVVSEGQSPTTASRIGTGTVDYTLTSVGEVPVDQKGPTPVVLTAANDEGNPLSWNGESLEYGQQKAYRFRVTDNLSFLEVRLVNTSGSPYMAVDQGGLDNARFPSITDSTYADEGGNSPDSQSASVVTQTAPNGDITVVVSANRDGSNEVAATYDLQVVAFGEVALDFDTGSAAITSQAPETWRYFKVEVPVGALGWDVRLANVSGGEPQMVIRRDELPTTTGGTYRLYQRDQWASGEYLTVPYTDMTGRSQDAAGVVEAYRVFHAGVTSPLTAPGTYYIGVRGQSGQTAALNYTIQSRGIGEGGSWSVPVTNLSYNGGVINGTGLAPREVAWYKVTVPANSRSLQLELDVQGAGEATLLVRQGKLPSVYATQAQSLDSDQVNRNEGIYLRKTGDEYFYKYQPSNGEFIPAGDYYVGVVSEGQSPTTASRIGTGTVDYTLTSVGEVSVDQKGPTPVVLTAANDEGNPLSWNGESLEYGQQKAYRFRVTDNLSFLEVRLVNTSGSPYMAVDQGGLDNARFPSITDSTYADEGGNSPDSQSASVVTQTAPNGDITVVVSANRDGSNEVAATYDLQVVAFGEVALDFDTGSAAITSQAPETWRYFKVEVPVGALGWDVRLANVSGGEPQMVIRRDELPTTTGGTYRLYQRDQWASGEYLTVPYTDMTGRSQDAAGVVEAYRVFHAGVTSPLTAPGTYYIGVRGQSGQTAALNYTIQSRGIGEGGSWSVPVTNLSYNGGVINGTGLAPREVAWYKVTVPANSRSLQLELDVQGAGEATLLVRQGKLPSVYATQAQSLDSDQVNRNEGIYLRKTGDEYFYKYQPSNGEFIPAGDYYVGVVSEGQSPTTASRIGTGTVDYTLTSVGEVPVDQKGPTPVVLTAGYDAVNPLTWANQSLAYGEQKSYRYQVDSGLQALEVRLINTTGMPYMALADDTSGPGKFPSISDSTYADEDGYTPIGQSASVVTEVNPQGVHTVTVSANKQSNTEVNASYDLLVIAKDVESDLAFNGGTNTTQLADEQMHFYRVVVPEGGLATGWKISLATTAGNLTGWVQKDTLPLPGQGLPLSTVRKDTVLTAPYLTAGTWYIAVKANGITDYSISSDQVSAEQVLAYSGASSGETDLEQGRWHFYSVAVPEGNTGVLRTALEAVSGDPELYIRRNIAPTLDHRSNGAYSGATLYDRYDTGNGTLYGNWAALTDTDQLPPGEYWLAVYANTTNVRYQLSVNDGNISDLPDPTYAVANQLLAAGDLAYYRFVMPDVDIGPPASIIEAITVNLQQTQGDVQVYIRDGIPPGQGARPNDWRDWNDDNSGVNPNPYISIDATGATVIDATALVPGATYYLGVYAKTDAEFDLQVDFASGTIALAGILDFQTGLVNTTLAAGEELLYLMDVPPDATRWTHTATHDSTVNIYVRESSIPFGNTYDDWYSSGSNGGLNCYLPQCSIRLRDAAGQRYFVRIVNNSGSSQPFTLQMGGKLIGNDDEDADGMLDWWEWQYFGFLGRTPGQDSDGDGLTNGEEYTNGTDPTDRAPVVTITSPADSSLFDDNDLIALQATAIDVEDGDIGPGIQWLSNIDGGLGGGASLSVSLSAGDHLVSATVTDSAGAMPVVIPSITLTVEVAEDLPGDINDDGEVTLADLLAMERYLFNLQVLDSAAMQRADIAPEGSPDGTVDLGDQLLLQRWLLNP